MLHVIATSFLPQTLGAWAAIVASLASTLGYLNARAAKNRAHDANEGVKEVHVLVNNRLDVALATIKDVTKERDALRLAESERTSEK